MAEKTITLTKQNAERLRDLHQVMDGMITLVRAGQLLNIQDLRVRTLLGHVREQGARDLVCRSQGRESPRKLSEESVVLDEVLCTMRFRTVTEGCVVKWRGRMFVLAKPSLTLQQQKLVVLERFDGQLSLRFKGRDLEYR